MISIIKRKIVSAAEAIHLRLFQHEMSDQMRKFLRHLSWSIVGGLSASAIMMAVNILAGRLMGPEEYGKYSLLITMAQMITIPILFGFDVSSVIAISGSKDDQEKRGNISSVIYFVLFSSVSIILLFLIVSPLLLKWFSLGFTFFLITLFYAVFTGLKNILDSIIRGLHLFKYQFLGKILEVVLVVVFFTVFFVLGNRQNYLFYVLSLGTGILFIISFYFKRIARYLSKFDIKYLKNQFLLARVLFVATLLGIGFNSIDKLIVARFLSFAELGIYSAYYMVSVNLVAQLTQMFINVFLPSISGIDNSAFIKKIDKVYSIGFLPIFTSLIGIIFIAIKLFGSKYGINFGYILSFSLLSTLQIYLTINSTIITSISKDFYKKFVLYLNIVNFVHLIIYGLMVCLNIVSIQLILILYIINVITLIVIQKYLINKMFITIESKND